MSRARFENVHPVLPSKNVLAAAMFYVEKLSFRPLFADNETDPRYGGVGRDKVELHLQWHDESEWAAVERPMIRFHVPDVDALFAEFEGKGVFHAGTALTDTAWGTREFAFYDLDGNGLTFYRGL